MRIFQRYNERKNNEIQCMRKDVNMAEWEERGKLWKKASQIYKKRLAF